MTFRPSIWHPIALILSVLNWVAAGFAIHDAEFWHTAAHVTLAMAFWLWAQRLAWRRGLEGSGHDTRLDLLEAEVGDLRRDLTEAQERLNFAERVLAQGPDPRRVGPER